MISNLTRKPQMAKKLICVISLSLPLWLGAIQAQADTSPKINDEAATKQQLDQLEADISRMRELLEEMKQKRSAAQESLRKTEVEMERLHKEIANIERRLVEGQQQLKKYQTRQHHLDVAKQRQQQGLAATLRAAYLAGHEPYLKLLLNQQDPMKLARQLEYLDYFNAARIKEIKAYNQTLQELKLVTDQINQQQLKLNEQHMKVVSTKEQLSTQRNERQKIISTLLQTIASKDKELSKLEQDRRELEQVLKNLQSTIANLVVPGKPFQFNKGKMPLPAKGAITQSFGAIHKQTKLRNNGLFIKASAGKPVYAIHHGRVVFSEWLRGSGLLIIIDHGDGFLSLYAHNQTLLKETGDWVKAGEKVATVGNTGGRQENGLYFEIRRKGKPQNPLHWCVAQ
ncbi:murein hydrolase activator EnvC family protein [Zooshikella sp. RANM57]|uniref:murein hydrolase activator EnvC family protein n=1 Tax=Zooshikella sp. RANM57 TaxID=3425863 RepID=UPI003D6DDE4D